MSPSQKQVCRVVLVLGLALATAVGAAAQPTFTKVFSPNTIGPGSASTLTFTIDNTGGGPVDMMAFTDVLPAGVTLATPASSVNGCGGTLTAPDGGGTITLIDGEVAAGGQCTISVNVTSTVVGTHMNVSGDLTSSTGNSGPAIDDLTVDTQRPGFTKSFSPSTVPLGSRSHLTFTIDNTANAVLLTSGSFTDTLPTGLEIADPANASTDCGTPPVVTTLTAVPGTSVVSFSFFGNAAFPFVGAGASCTITVDVVPTGQGVLENVSGILNSNLNFPPGGNVDAGRAVATLTSTVSELVLIKEFLADPVPPGGTVDLEFTILNRDRDFEATGVTFSDNLGDAGGTLNGLAAVAPLPMNPCGAGSSLSGTTTLMLTNGTIPAQGSCSFTVTLQVPPGATPGIYPNTTSAVIGTVGELVIGNMATDDLFVFPAPTITKTFLDNPVAAGDTTTLRFTITNTSTTFMATDVAFSDFFPTIMATASAVPAAACCGAGSSCTFFPLVNPPPPADVTPARFFLSGGSLAPAGMAGDVCTFDITLDVSPTAAAGFYDNETSTVTATVDGDAVEGNPATDTLEVVGGVQLNKEFTDDPVAPGDTVTLQFTILHDQNATGDATSINFTDDLDATLTGLAPLGLPLMNICGAGSQLADNMGTLEFTGGTLAPGEMCQFSVTLQVPMAATAGTYPNTTSTVDATVSGLTVTTPAATDDLIVAGLTLMKEFTNDPVIPGGTVTLQFTLVNEAGAPAASNIFFSDSLSSVVAGLTFDPGSVPLTPCGGGSTITLLSGNTLMQLSGGTLGSGEMCQFSVTVDVGAGVASGTYPNVTQSFGADFGSGLVFLPNAADTLIVAGDVLQLTKTFLTNPAAPGDLVDLEFELTNLSASGMATAIAFTDDLDTALTGLVATNLPVAGCSGTAAANPGPGTIDFTGGTLGSGASCTFTVTVQVPAMPAASSALNTTSMVTGTIGGLGVTGDPASDTLLIQNVDFTKSFAGPTTAGGTVVLTFTIDNLTATPVADLGFTDDLNAFIPGAEATGLPLVTPCGALSSLTGTGFLTFSGGDLAGNASCMFNVTLQMPAAVSAGLYPNTTSGLSASGLQVADPATDTLEVEPPPSFFKVFAPDLIGTTNISTLTFTVDNSASAVAATSLDFTDNLPAGVVVANPANASTTCTGGTITAVPGSGVIGYTGGTASANLSCLVNVDVTSTMAGVYVNVTGDLTSDSGNSGTATDTLTVEGPPLFAKIFAPDIIASTATSTLTFTIDNSANTLAVTALAFTDNLPAGLEVANPAVAGTTCTGGTVTAVAGSGVVSYTGGSLGGGATCAVTVDVAPTASGVLVNTSGDLTSSSGNSGPAMATLTVDPPPLFTKAFSPNVVALDEATTLSFTIDNAANVLDATGLAFTDNLPVGMEVADPANAMTDCGAGTVTANPGDTTVDFSGGSVAAGMACTVSVDVFSTTLGANVNVTEVLSSSLGDSAPATGTLTVAGSVTEIPTLGTWSLLLLMLGLGLLGVWRLRG